MNDVNHILKKGELTLKEIVNIQIILYCYSNNIIISSSDLECLTILAITGECNLTEFCDYVSDLEIFSSSQSVRNSLNKSENKKLIIKKGKSKKTIYINPILKIQAEGNIFLEIKYLRKDLKGETSVNKNDIEKLAKSVELYKKHNIYFDKRAEIH